MEKKARLLSLDVLRGFDMFFVMGGSGLMVKMAVAFGWGADGAFASQFRHAAWNGFHFEDTIFPLFLFIAGVAFPFSLAKQRERGATAGAVLLKALRRVLTLFVLGLVVNGLFKLDFAHLRYFNVLGRIGLAWFLAASVRTLFGTRTCVVAAVGLVAVHALATLFLVAPDFPDASPLSAEGNIGCWLDRRLFAGHLYKPLFDPEGCFGVLTATATALLGVLAGDFVRTEDGGTSGIRRVVCMAIGGVVLAFAGLALSAVIPLNKALWSSSFTLVAGGYSLVMFALFHWLIDVRQRTRGTFFFKVIGMNAITIYMVKRMVDFNFTGRYFLCGVLDRLQPDMAAFVLQVAYVVIGWLLLWFLFRKNIFLKV